MIEIPRPGLGMQCQRLIIHQARDDNELMAAEVWPLLALAQSTVQLVIIVFPGVFFQSGQKLQPYGLCPSRCRLNKVTIDFSR
jgi:hypothetical protein